jgi:hypothetical protein
LIGLGLFSLVDRVYHKRNLTKWLHSIYCSQDQRVQSQLRDRRVLALTTQSVWKQLIQLAYRERTSVSALIHEFIVDGLKRRKKR